MTAVGLYESTQTDLAQPLLYLNPLKLKSKRLHIHLHTVQRTLYIYRGNVDTPGHVFTFGQARAQRH